MAHRVVPRTPDGKLAATAQQCPSGLFGTARPPSVAGGNSAASSASSLKPAAFAASIPAALARSRYRRNVERDICAPIATALTLGPSSVHSRKTSLIRRISDLGLGILTTPLLRKRGNDTCHYFDVSSDLHMSQGWPFHRPQVANSIGPVTLGPPPNVGVEAVTLAHNGSPSITHVTLPTCHAHYPVRIERVHMSIASPSTQPSPVFRRVGIRTFTIGACSSFTRVAARWIAQPPKAAFITRLRTSGSPRQSAR